MTTRLTTLILCLFAAGDLFAQASGYGLGPPGGGDEMQGGAGIQTVDQVDSSTQCQRIGRRERLRGL